MYRPYRVAKLRVTQKNPIQKIPRSLIAFFFALILLLGIDFGFTNVLNKRIHPFIKLLIGALTIYIVFILASPFIRKSLDDMYWVGLVLIQYVLYSIAIRLTLYTFYDFVVDIYSIDEGITSLHSEKIGAAVWVYGTILYGSKWVILYFLCTAVSPESCATMFIPYYVYGIFSQAADLVSVVRILIYYYVYCCVKYLNELCANENVKIELIKTLYTAIANCYDNIRPFSDKLMCLELLFEVPKLMGLLWHMLKHIRYQEGGWLGYFGDYVYASHIMSFIFITSLLVQMVQAQVEKLQLKMHNIIIDEQDEQRYREASRLVVYMKARRLQHEVAGLIPIDLRLPAALVNICATYLIVVVQFTHLYD